MHRLFVVPTLFCGLLAAAPTFHKDVEPILQKNCQGCHRAGEAAPMSLMTYQEARPWAKALKAAVVTRKMPPWFADRTVNKFHNDTSLKTEDIETIAAWADSGAKQGNPKDGPTKLTFAEGWRIARPDLIIEMPEAFTVPASGTIDYQYVIVPSGFTEDKWVTMAENRPGNRAVVHHIITFVRDPGSKWLGKYPVGKLFAPKEGQGDGGAPSDWVSGYAPGTPADILEPGKAKLIKAGADIVFQLHYTANGKEQTDRSRLGLVFAREEPKERVLTFYAQNSKFVIPPGAAEHTAKAAFTLQGDATVTNFLPHMHLRGKAMDIDVVYPDGRRELVLRVPNYDFNWQLGYMPVEPIRATAGTKIEVTCKWDNSANNKHNPDPTREVKFGEQSWDEMCFGFYDLVFPAKLDPTTLLRAPKKPAAASSAGGLE